MTAPAARARSRPPVADPVRPGEPGRPPARLGPVATLLAQVALGANLVLAFDVFDLAPSYWSLAAGPALGAFLLAPRAVLARLRVSLPLLLLLVWTALSLAWSVNLDATLFELRVRLPPLLGLVVVSGLLPSRDIVSVLRWVVRFVIAIQVVTLLTDPASREAAATGVEGWRGSFIHKNAFGPFLAVAAAVALTLERGWVRVVLVSALVVMLVGSSSWTGRAAASAAALTWMSLGTLRRGDQRNRPLVLLATLALTVAFAVSVASSFTTIVSATGRDTSLTGRTDIWAASIEVIDDRPLVGYGVGAFIDRFEPSSATRRVWEALVFDAPHAHNGVIEVAGEVGLVGVALVAVVVLGTVSSSIRHVRTRPAEASAILGITVVQLVSAVAEPTLLRGGWIVLLVLLRGWSLQLDRAPPAPEREAAGAGAGP